jgi:hypothetical protein
MRLALQTGMDERSRKLLSPKALPKVSVPASQPHEKREFRLPDGVKRAESAPDLASLRAAALGLGKPAPGAARVPAPAPLPTKTMAPLGPATSPAEKRWPPIGTPAPTRNDIASGWARPDATPPQAEAKPQPPAPAPLAAPLPAPPAPPVLPAPLPQRAAPRATPQGRYVPPPLAKPMSALPPPLPPPPVVVAPPKPKALIVDKPKALIVEESMSHFHGEHTSMWFKAGDEMALDDAPAPGASVFGELTQAVALRERFWTPIRIAAAAGGGLGVILLLLLV